ncbi:hypothetical protein HMPREF3155_01795 [Corynebacterium sp. HMSC06D04]|uniref:hypothetical protein n=1 Tax=unclassified Corynebacterium TaxID=2624378 RepID=UPI0008A35A57|nr:MULTISPECIES: hypothetical protein [unclassified Corynebacterium]OFT44740.1 hypothetical protein HMPREF3158_10720 [Corynebacterium sp. HMSC06G04]OFT53106.1 hypothetical protein HMPREF3155_01795 [Corynebacterium sp. HMSC06D04]
MLLPPEHVLNAFHAGANLRKVQSEVLGPEWDHGIKVGDVVFARANELSGWSAKVREKLAVEGARVVRPVLSTDARFTAAGWKANQYVPGQLRGRIDETAQMALRLDAALSTFPMPNVGQRDDVFARAERAAWAETGEAYSAELTDSLPVGIAHVDVLGTTVYSGANPPALVDVVPSAAPRPLGWSAALVIVDGLVAESVDDGICSRFGHVPGMPQLLLRASAYRRYVNNLHPASKSTTRSNIERVEALLVSRASEILNG